MIWGCEQVSRWIWESGDQNLVGKQGVRKREEAAWDRGGRPSKITTTEAVFVKTACKP